jgi:hypothetical protein
MKKSFHEPVVITYSPEELVLDTAFTGTPGKS